MSLPQEPTRYVLDFLVDLCTPYLGKDTLRGTWAIGFFGRRACEISWSHDFGGENQWTSSTFLLFNYSYGKWSVYGWFLYIYL